MQNPVFSGQKPVGGTAAMMQWASGTGTTQTGTGTTQTGIGTNRQGGTGAGTNQSGIGTTTPNSPVFAYFTPLSPIFIHRLFRNPKKLLMGVQIRMRLSEKCTAPRRLGDIRLV